MHSEGLWGRGVCPLAVLPLQTRYRAHPLSLVIVAVFLAELPFQGTGSFKVIQIDKVRLEDKWLKGTERVLIPLDRSCAPTY